MTGMPKAIARQDLSALPQLRLRTMGARQSNVRRGARDVAPFENAPEHLYCVGLEPEVEFVEEVPCGAPGAPPCNGGWPPGMPAAVICSVSGLYTNSHSL